MDKAKAILKFVVVLGESVDLSLADNKIDFQDLPNVMAPIAAAGAAFKDFKLGLQQFKNADTAQLQELASFVRDDLNLRSDRTEELIEDAFEMAVRLYSVVKAFTK